MRDGFESCFVAMCVVALWGIFGGIVGGTIGTLIILVIRAYVR